MSMNAQTSQMPSSKLSRPGAVKLRGLLAPGLTLSLILAGPIFAGPLRAEVRPAEIAAADRALGANAAASKDPAKKALLEKKEELEQAIDQLKYEKASMNADDYKKQLTRLLLELAKTQEEIDK